MVFEHDYKNYPELSNSQIAEFGFSSPHKQITEDFTATVIKVHDGDTVTLRTDFRDFDFPLRLAGVDSPEMNNGGEEARDWLKNKILNQDVQIIIDPDNRVGKYGRLIGQLMFRGMDMAQEEIYLGLAFEFGKKLEGEVYNADKIFSTKQWVTS